MPDGSTHPAKTLTAETVTDVFARHGFGLCRFTGAQLPTTFLTADAEGNRPLGWVRGLKADGEIIPTQFHGKSRRLTLVREAV